MSAQDGETGYLSTRRIQLTDDSLVGRERMIALAAAELILSSWEQIAETNTRSATNVEMSDEQHDDGTMSHLEPTTTIAQKKTTRSTPHARKRLAAPSRHPVQEEADPPENSRPLNSETVLLRELGLRVSATGQLFPSAKLWLWGGELAGMLVWNDAFELQLSGGASGGRATRRSGTASLFWSGGALLLGVRGTPFFSGLRGALLAGFRWGYGRLHGRPRTGEIRGHVVSGPNGGPLMRLSLALPVRPRIGVSMEMGYAAWGIKGYVAGASDVNMSEWWGMLAINLCFIRRLHDKK